MSHLLEETVLHGCPHCVGFLGSCCQCNGSRFVPLLVAQRNLEWVWGYFRCGCHACGQLTAQRAAIAAAAKVAPQADRHLLVTSDDCAVPDPDGTFRGHFRRRCAYCGKRRDEDTYGVYCSDLCRRRARAVDTRRARLAASASG